MHEHRSWFPAILIGLSLALAVCFLMIFNHRDGKSFFVKKAELAPQAAPAVTAEGYEASVNSVLDMYADDRDAKAAYNALILLRVPASYQTVHFDLVVAMGKLMGGDKADGEARLTAVKAQYSWLHL